MNKIRLFSIQIKYTAFSFLFFFLIVYTLKFEIQEILSFGRLRVRWSFLVGCNDIDSKKIKLKRFRFLLSKLVSKESKWIAIDSNKNWKKDSRPGFFQELISVSIFYFSILFFSLTMHSIYLKIYSKILIVLKLWVCLITLGK